MNCKFIIVQLCCKDCMKFYNIIPSYNYFDTIDTLKKLDNKEGESYYYLVYDEFFNFIDSFES